MCEVLRAGPAQDQPSLYVSKCPDAHFPDEGTGTHRALHLPMAMRRWEGLSSTPAPVRAPPVRLVPTSRRRWHRRWRTGYSTPQPEASGRPQQSHVGAGLTLWHVSRSMASEPVVHKAVPQSGRGPGPVTRPPRPPAGQHAQRRGAFLGLRPSAAPDLEAGSLSRTDKDLCEGPLTGARPFALLSTSFACGTEQRRSARLPGGHRTGVR